MSRGCGVVGLVILSIPLAVIQMRHVLGVGLIFLVSHFNSSWDLLRGDISICVLSKFLFRLLQTGPSSSYFGLLLVMLHGRCISCTSV